MKWPGASRPGGRLPRQHSEPTASAHGRRTNHTVDPGEIGRVCIRWNEGHGLHKFFCGDRTYEMQYAIAGETAMGCAPMSLSPGPIPARPPGPDPAAAPAGPGAALEVTPRLADSHGRRRRLSESRGPGAGFAQSAPEGPLIPGLLEFTSLRGRNSWRASRQPSSRPGTARSTPRESRRRNASPIP